jgi:hypothetical protein
VGFHFLVLMAADVATNQVLHWRGLKEQHPFGEYPADQTMA